MTEAKKLNNIRGAALDRIQRAERNFKLALLGAAVLEAVFLVTFLLLTDLSNRLHVLILVGTLGSYTMLAIGLVLLASYLNRSNLRLLQALEMRNMD